MPTDPKKVREDRLRRMAQRQGYTLTKSRRRDPLAYDYGWYRLQGADADAFEGLDGVEAYLTRHVTKEKS
jgi:hypothetical protein